MLTFLQITGLAVLSLVGVGLGLRGLWRSRRARVLLGRRVDLCKACRYDLTGLPADRLCPECGHDVTCPDGRIAHERGFSAKVFLSSLGMAALAGVVLAGFVLLGSVWGFAPHHFVGWANMPEWMVVRGVAGGACCLPYREVRTRLIDGKLGARAASRVVRASLDLQADPRAQWGLQKGDLVQLMRARGLVTDAQWRRYAAAAVVPQNVWAARFAPQASPFPHAWLYFETRTGEPGTWPAGEPPFRVVVTPVRVTADGEALAFSSHGFANDTGDAARPGVVLPEETNALSRHRPEKRPLLLELPPETPDFTEIDVTLRIDTFVGDTVVASRELTETADVMPASATR